MHKVTLEFSESGKICFIRNSNGVTVGELFIHGPFRDVLVAALSREPVAIKNSQPLPKVFRGEVYGLAGYEFLDKTNEVIVEK